MHPAAGIQSELSLKGRRLARSTRVPGALSRFLCSHDAFRLGSFLSLDDVELHIVTFFQALVSIQLDGTVVNKHIRAIFSADKPVSLGVIEPLYFPDILSHFAEPFSGESWLDTYVTVSAKTPCL